MTTSEKTEPPAQKRLDRQDALFAIGSLLIMAGLLAIWWKAALIFAGLLLWRVAQVAEWEKTKRNGTG